MERHEILLPVATVEVAESLLLVTPALGFLEIDAVASLPPGVRIRVLLPAGLSRSEGTAESVRQMEALRDDGHDVEVRYAEGLPSQRCAIADGERLYPDPDESRAHDLRANTYMLALGVGEDVEEAIRRTEELWEGARPVEA